MSTSTRFGALTTALFTVISGACQTPGTRSTGPLQSPSEVKSGVSPPAMEPSPRQRELAALDPQAPLPTIDVQKGIESALETHLARNLGERAYIQTDKPIYQPGETIWMRAALRRTRDLTVGMQEGSTIQLISPKGAVVIEKRVMVQSGVAASALDLPPEVQGGEYVLQVTADNGAADKRSIIVASYEAPRLKKTLEFARKAYGPGDTVLAAVNVARGTGEPFAKKPLTAIVTVDDQEIARTQVTTDDKGGAVVRFNLPGTIAREDGLLTILADDGGVTESIQKRVPIVLKTVAFDMFPEGGDLVEGLPGRVYFSAKNTMGKPADVAGRVLDDQGHEVASFVSLHDGLGRFELTPQKGRKYHVELSRPTGSTQKVDVPAALARGCTLEAIDDPGDARADVRVAAFCSEPQTVIAEATLREKRLGGAAYEVAAGKPTIISLPAPRGEQGAVRVTLLSEKKDPLAERLIYKGRRADLKVEITADKPGYAPRDRVSLTVKTTDLAGKPVPASLGLAVVDDTVLSFADDKSGNILSRLYLEPELGADPVEEPNYYFSDKPEAAAAMDLLMGTRGWRRFEWQLVFNPPPPPPPTAMPVDMAAAEGAMPPEAPMPAPPMAKAEEAKPVDKAKRGAQPARPVAQAPAKPVAAAPERARKEVQQKDANLDEKQDLRRAPMGGAGKAAGRAMDRDDEWGGGDGLADNRWNFEPVRVFPAPEYKPGAAAGPRSDFRETIFWAHDVRTDASGVAKVGFSLSDSVTSFRVTAEGSSQGGLPGRGEAVLSSKLPVSLDVRLPVEVSEGDVLRLPVTLSNETDRPMPAAVRTSFGAAFKVGASPFDKPIMLKPHEKRAAFIPLTVVGKGGEGEVQIAMETDGLSDEVKKSIRVVPLGFPFQKGASGTAKGTMRHEFDLTGAMPGTITAKVQLFPSPVASNVAGMEAMIREPGGCFEQTSSSNYPNIMVMRYLQENDAADADLLARTDGTLGRGYKLLTGYEAKDKGYEWFGESPGHEALTAYGLMEFKDMADVWDDVDRAMIERTADWLMKRRDGKGGYQRNAKALDSFGRASETTTNLYITWALAEAGRAKGLEAELALSRKVGLDSKDPYLVALAATTAIDVAPSAPETRALVDRLVGLAQKDGSFTGAKESITMSGGDSLTIESTALATYALVKAARAGMPHENELRASVTWLNAHRGGYGEWSNTQATVLGLRAMSAYTSYSRQTQASGTARVRVNGKDMGSVDFAKGRREAIEFGDLSAALVPGKNVIEVILDSEASLPYTVAVEYRAARPASSPDATIGLSTELGKKDVKLGEGVKLHARIENKTQEGKPMTLARLGLPGGLTFQTWQFKELRDKKIIGFYETRQREVILYFRDLKPGQVIDLDLDLIASVPGHYVAPASSAYLYYTNEDKTWVAPSEVTVTE